MTLIRKYIAPLFIIALLATAVYGGTLHYPFLFDDQAVAIDNPTLRHISSIPRFFITLSPAGENDTTGLYRPMLFTTYTLNYIYSGLDTFSYHLFDLLLHIVNSILLFLIIVELQKLTKSENQFVALLFAALFCVHPVLTQSVIYITARSVTLTTFFCLGSFLYYIKYRTGTNAWLLAASAVLFGCALLTKESAPPFLGVIILAELYFQEKHSDGIKTAAKRIMPFVAAAVIFVAIRFYILSNASKTLVTGGYIEHWLAEVSVLPRYMALVVSPFGICVEHYVPDAHITDGWFLAGLVIIAASSLLFLRYFNNDRLLACLFAWPFLALLPEMLVPLPERMVDYRLYLSVAGLVVFLSVASSKILKGFPKPVAKACASIMICLLIVSGVLAFEKGKVWSSRKTLWQDAIDRYPNLSRPYNNFAEYLLNAREYGEAIRVLTIAVKIKPDFYDAYNNLGVAYGITGNYEMAREMLEKAISINPGLVNSYINLGSIYGGKGDLKEAIRIYRKALEIDHFSPKVYYNLGAAYLETGAYKEAFEVFLAMSENCPENGQSKLAGAGLLRKYGQNELASRLMESQ